MKNKLIALAVVLGIMSGGMWLGTEWTINRISIPAGKSLQLRYKGPLFMGGGKNSKQRYWAEEGEIGVSQKLRGPGQIGRAHV